MRLPELPDVLAQFEASIKKAKRGERGEYTLPKTAATALNAWLNSVRLGHSKAS